MTVLKFDSGILAQEKFCQYSKNKFWSGTADVEWTSLSPIAQLRTIRNKFEYLHLVLQISLQIDKSDSSGTNYWKRQISKVFHFSAHTTTIRIYSKNTFRPENLVHDALSDRASLVLVVDVLKAMQIRVFLKFCIQMWSALYDNSFWDEKV